MKVIKMTETNRLINTKELADYIGSTEGSIRTWQCIGKIPQNWCVRLGNAIRYDRVEVDKAIENCKLKGRDLNDLFQDSSKEGSVYGC